MNIPLYALNLMNRLEDAGFECWAVGGCVRDSILGQAPHDWDLCTNASPEEMKALFADFDLVLNGEKHGTVGVVSGGKLVEITTFRSEGGYTDARHPQWVHFEKSIAADLARRDFTVNAMAYSPRRGLADPWGGEKDLKAGILRAVGVPEERFREDGLRILRGIRFAARFGLTVEGETLNAMTRLAPTLSLQARERVYTELCGFLLAAKAEDLLTFAPVLASAIPELAPIMGFQQNNPHHAWDVFTHTAHAVEAAPKKLSLRWAALLHDVGKPQTYTVDEKGVGHFKGHAKVGAEMAESILLSLKSPKVLRQEVCTLIANHGLTRDLGHLDGDKPIRRLLRKLGQPLLYDLMALDRADEGSKGTSPGWEDFDRFQRRLEEILLEKPCMKVSDLVIGGSDLMRLGIPQGPELGRILGLLLDEVTDGVLENEKAALLHRAEVLGRE